MKWYLEKDFASTDDLVVVLEKHGIDYEVLSVMETIKIKPSTVKHNRISNASDDICYGSFKFIYLTYGTFDFHQFEYLSYMDTIHEFLLNDRHLITTLPHLVTHAKYATELWSQEMLFIKPNSGLKPFDAQKCHFRHVVNLAKEIEADRLMEFDPLIFICPARDDIKEEYRFVIIDNVVVTGSQYKPTIAYTYNGFAAMYAGAIALRLKNTIKTRAYTIDIALLDNDELRVVEVNSFNCAGLYKCDLDLIVEELSC